MYKFRSVLAFVLVTAIAFSSCKKDSGSVDTNPPVIPPVDPPVDPPQDTTTNGNYILKDNDHLLFGNPSDAKAVLDSPNNYLMDKKYYYLSYSRDKGISNWVAWHLNSDDLGSAKRQDDFRADNALPTGWYMVGSSSYSGSGFDRGHSCPSADRTSSTIANSSTFFMTNMIPQAPKNNQQTWANMESYLRDLVIDGNEVYIVMGTYGSGGSGSKGEAYTIDNGRIKVPAYVWKTALVIPNGNDDTSRVDANTRLISVVVPNRNDVMSNWKSYRTSLEVIEYATGLNIFSRIKPHIKEVLKKKVDDKN